MEENLLKIFKLADMLNEKQSKIYAEIEYTADNKKKLQISIRAKDTYRYIEKCEVQLAYSIGVAKPVAVYVDTFELFESYIGGVSDE